MTALEPYDPEVEARKRAERQCFPMHALERLIPRQPDSPGRRQEVAEALGTTVGQLRYYRRMGLTEAQADHLAVKLGYVPDIIEGWSY